MTAAAPPASTSLVAAPVSNGATAPADAAAEVRSTAAASLADALEATLEGLEGDATLHAALRARLLRSQAAVESAEAQLADLAAHSERERQAAVRAEAVAEAARSDGLRASANAAATKAASDKALADTAAAKRESDNVTKAMEARCVRASLSSLSPPVSLRCL